MTVASAAWAGDGAAVEPLGFSSDGRTFAFEQYGTESVSGMDYSRTDVIAVATNGSVDDVPLVVDTTMVDDSLLQDPNQDPLLVVRRQARQQAAPLLQQFGINGSGTRVGIIAASHSRETTLAIADETDGRQSPVVMALQQAAVATMPLEPSVFGAGARLELQEQAVASSASTCADYGHTAKVFTLTLLREGKPPLVLGPVRAAQTDEGCPLGFGLAEAHALHLADGSIALAVLVQRFEYVMEDPDRRFTAVTALVK
ncbi:DUF2259 domain-containing protein [Mesorhizobium sp. AR07]|uniref:DUF2259 domain-containing protein n=1 Tax=Mesorhizobium sp. AR07 TaxID=2865838 RepID=UPI00215F8D68|nr:DUF2259 domain-containing protein [Mesorhizobium sp. AR07]UVK43344.1 DUF2259 domain-containing protein [Mesorhizobium sp. AR07]